MKLLSDYPGAGMSMAASIKLRLLIKDVLMQEKVSHIIETGTYQGLGSTKFISESFHENSFPKVFVTIEANWMSWRKAKNNLRRFPFVKALWGKTVAMDKALSFLQNDKALRNHNEYPDIFIDNINDPLQFYHNEVLGELGGKNVNPMSTLQRTFDNVFYYSGDDLLEKYLHEYQHLNPMVILDSCGGIGFLEFSILQNVMLTQTYLVLLDDISHIKHFRSYKFIKNSPHFHIIGVDEHEGWLIAKHSP